MRKFKKLEKYQELINLLVNFQIALRYLPNVSFYENGLPNTFPRSSDPCWEWIKQTYNLLAKEVSMKYDYNFKNDEIPEFLLYQSFDEYLNNNFILENNIKLQQIAMIKQYQEEILFLKENIISIRKDIEKISLIISTNQS